MKVLITGAAGFIGSHVALYLTARGDDVVGLDNFNDYYDVSLKRARHRRTEQFLAGSLGEDIYAHVCRPVAERGSFRMVEGDLADRALIEKLFGEERFDKVVHLAAQAGVRYSIENPHAYIDSNIVGTMNILEGCRHHRVQHLVYASSSSVYGANESMPFSVHDNVDHPLSLYAASKKANELMAHTYSHLYDLPTTGLRFFTVYGPWGRPDMALFLFTKAILADQPIDVFNYGKHRRDFTYIDDIVEGVVRTLDHTAVANPNWSGEEPDPGTSKAPWRVYNIGNQSPVELLDYIGAIEEALGKRARQNLLPLQPGDVPDTYADVQALVDDVNYRPATDIKVGVRRFVDWYTTFYKKP
ncbi:NAD-dependent epimerase [Exilibacterium tricleocarpae]|uniref:NAD-dependent epimerase n=1 Tax=Exilibacterium tricleocarpae TaxID=2591008 RepID=A0A545TKG3_9GAMM|nr:NAD-dependent epimerase [Exilibacterium tricleocarpae]TQV77651.1 NAD-dependent epimerase [Exilibacterium tricleocarpae]